MIDENLLAHLATQAEVIELRDANGNVVLTGYLRRARTQRDSFDGHTVEMDVQVLHGDSAAGGS